LANILKPDEQDAQPYRRYEVEPIFPGADKAEPRRENAGSFNLAEFTVIEGRKREPSLSEQRERLQDERARFEEERDAFYAQRDDLMAQWEAEGRERGYAAGREEGIAQGRLEFLEEINRFGKMIEELGKAQEAFLTENLQTILTLAAQMAGRMLRAELTVAPERFLEVVRAAIACAVDRTELTVRVNPQDYDLVLEHKAELLTEKGETKKISIVRDEDISPGGCVIETLYGEVDARLETCIAEAEKLLLGELGNQRAEDA